jgi:hypothetical protein
VRALLLLALALAAARPAVAKPSLAKVAASLCRGDLDVDPREVLSKAGGRAVAPLLAVLASAQDDDECEQEAFPLLVDVLCDAQTALHGSRVTPAFAPVRAALTSADPRRVTVALDVLSSLNGIEDHDVGFEGGQQPRAPTPRCEDKQPILAAAAVPLARLLEHGRGATRDQALQLVMHLDLDEVGAQFVPPLVRLLDDRDTRDRATVLLAKIGKPAAAAAPHLGRLLAAAAEPAAESAYASALVAIQAPSAPAAAALPARLDEALPGICQAGPPRFPALFRAARVVGPPPGMPRDRWAAGLVGRAHDALARIAPPCVHPEIARDVILDLAKLPPSAAQRDVLEAQMLDANAATEHRFWAAWALRSLGARLSAPSAAVQEEYFGASDQPSPPLPDKAEALGPLRRSAVVAGMNAVKPKVAACYARYQVQGMALVNVEIAPWGRIDRARATGKFAGTPTGACVEQAVKTARFPVSRGLTTAYPFQLK